MAYKWKTIEPGIRTREHETRKNGVRPDTYFTLRFSVNGRQIEEGLGWATQGWTVAKARTELAKLRESHRTGVGESTLAEKRMLAKQKKDFEQSKPTILKLFSIYQEQKGSYANRPTDNTNFKHFSELHERLPETIRTHEVSVVAKKLQESGKTAQTVRNVIELLRRIVNFGIKQELIEQPRGLRFEMPKVDNDKTECLSTEQAKALFIALDEDQDQNLASMMRLAIFTGMRRGALFGLQWQDLDFKNGHIILRGEEAKSGKTTTIPMTQAARKVLEAIKPQASNYLFPNPKTGAKRTECRAFLKRIKAKAMLPDDFRPLHGLRHTYASWLASSGKVDLFTLQRLMTHESPQMTQRYAHLADESVKKAASVIDECVDIAIDTAKDDSSCED